MSYTMMPDYQEGQVVHPRPQFLQKYPHWEGAEGVIEEVVTRYLPAIKVLWLTGPKEGKTVLTPFYQVIPEGQEELLTLELEDEQGQETTES